MQNTLYTKQFSFIFSIKPCTFSNSYVMTIFFFHAFPCTVSQKPFVAKTTRITRFNTWTWYRICAICWTMTSTVVVRFVWTRTNCSWNKVLHHEIIKFFNPHTRIHAATSSTTVKTTFLTIGTGFIVFTTVLRQTIANCFYNWALCLASCLK